MRKVSMPSSTAASFNSAAPAFCRISFRSPADMFSTSYSPCRPFMPLPLHASQPLPRKYGSWPTVVSSDSVSRNGSASGSAPFFAPSSASCVNRISRSVVLCFTLPNASSAALGSYFSRQFLQMRRTSRCARIRFNALETLNGSSPMSMRRVMVSGALLVCNVLSTMCPVSAALIAIEPVSRSRISPTMMTFGS